MDRPFDVRMILEKEGVTAMEQYDLAVIGAGPGGYMAALEAAKLGQKTALFERRELGGTCLNRGCIPTKALLHAADLYASMRDAEKFGVFAENPAYDMEKMQVRKDEVVQKLRDGIAALMKKNKVTVYADTAAIAAPHTIRTGDGQEITAEKILIATGSVPALPPIPGADFANVMTSDELLSEKRVFPRLVIVGGGVIGMEFASLYQELGCQVTVVEFLDSILANMDKEISQNLKMIMKKRGVDIHTAAKVERITAKEDGTLVCHYLEKEKEQEAEADGILIATGRRANTEGLFADGFAVEMERGRILVDENGKTSVDSIYAAGDVTGGIMLAHAATAQAINEVHHMLGNPAPFEMSLVPGCVYTDPEIGSVGLTQDEAKKQGLDILVKKYPMSANGKTVLSDQDRGFIKVVAEKESGKILGAQMMCARATDMISQFTAAIANGLTVGQLAKVIYPHPTFSEGIGEALRG